MKKNIVLTVLCFIFFSKAFAQTYDVPDTYTLKEKADYGKYENNIINTVDWLHQNPWGNEPEKVQKANSFIIAWIEGSPTVTIQIGKELTYLIADNKQLLITFLGGYVKYCLQHKDDTNKVHANVAALRELLTKYQAEKDHVKDSSIEKLIKKDKEGKLESWAASNLE